jgi:SAM-dependent methyltransferase
MKRASSAAAVEAIGARVRRFYEECSFPGYDDVETADNLARSARNDLYLRLVDEQIARSARVLDAGCGTGQLVNFLALEPRRTVVGIDLSRSSLRKAHAFKKRFGIAGARFVQMDVFGLALPAASFDVVFSNGVLHHTGDARRGFRELCRLVRPGGHIVLGLYNPFGRLMLRARKALFRVTGSRFASLDFMLRQRSVSPEKKRIWFMDQYRHPHEQTISVAAALGWFRENGFEYVNSVPKINPAERLTPDELLFERHEPGTALHHLAAQLRWIYSMGGAAGFFVLIGRRPAS